MKDLFTGSLVRLEAVNPQRAAEAYSRWYRNSEYSRLLDSVAARPRSFKAVKEWIEKKAEKDPPDEYPFSIYTLEEDRLIGEIGLDGIKWNHGEAFVGIGLGERDCWGKGYGTDAMRLILGFAFNELNLHRVSLTVFEYNTRAIRTYEKIGFVHEGQNRGMLLKDRKRFDMVHMGILRHEWETTCRQGDLHNVEGPNK